MAEVETKQSWDCFPRECSAYGVSGRRPAEARMTELSGALSSLQCMLLIYTWGKRGPEWKQDLHKQAASRLIQDYGKDLPFSCLWLHVGELSWTRLRLQDTGSPGNWATFKPPPPSRVD